MIEGNSDSFPGIMALLTGGTPKSHGIYYDVHYNRDLWPGPNSQASSYNAPGPANCTPGTKPAGNPGTETDFDETLDKDMTNWLGGGTGSWDGIDPTTLPVNATCYPVYPHSRARVNNIFELVRAKGKVTCWADKHPAYDLVRGPSGTGVVDLFTPEQEAPYSDGSNKTFPAYKLSPDLNKVWDGLHTAAIVNWMKGMNWNATAALDAVPTVMGANYQIVSVAQKFVNNTANMAKHNCPTPGTAVCPTPGGKPSVSGGYESDGLTPNYVLQDALNFADNQIAQMIAAAMTAGIYQNTAFVITAKHGQAPMQSSTLKFYDDGAVFQDGLNNAGFPVALEMSDDASFIWLKNQSQAVAAAAYLNSQGAAVGIQKAYAGAELQALGWLGNPLNDAQTPDIAVLVVPGTVYAGHATKAAEHGGFNKADLNVALLVSRPTILARKVSQAPVKTRDVAPTILAMLGYDYSGLQACGIETCSVLPFW